MTRYSIFSLARNALSNHQNWPKVWRSPEPKSRYEIVIIGGGGHGLATAYYLAKNHGIKNVAVVEKGWLGGGNTGRNTTIVRSNYGQPGNTLFYEKSMQLWEGLSKDLNYNVMMSHRGVLNLAHNDAQIDAFQRRGNTMRINNIDAEWLSLNQVQVLVPLLNCSSRTRFPVKGGLLQPRAGTARHDAVAWGFARGADKYGIDIIQNCEVTGIDVHAGEVKGVQTTRGPIRATKVATAVAGHTAHLCEMVGMRMPLETHVLQAMVSEPIKPCLNTVITSGAAHVYISQSDKGELVFGGDLDFYPSYAQRGNFPRIEDVAQNVVSLFPAFGRLRLMRTWGGIMDMSMDGSPIISTSHIKGFFINGGWCYGGFKATPGSGWVYAHTIANDAPHELNIKFALNRFESGALIDESGNGATAKAH